MKKQVSLCVCKYHLSNVIKTGIRCITRYTQVHVNTLIFNNFSWSKSWINLTWMLFCEVTKSCSFKRKNKNKSQPFVPWAALVLILNRKVCSDDNARPVQTLCLGARRALMHKSSFGRCPAGPMWSKTEHPGGLGGAKRLTHFLLGETWAACTGSSRDLNHRVHIWLELEWRLLLLWTERRGSPDLFLVNVRLRESEAHTAKEDPWQRLATALPECEFGFEHSLSLQSCSLSDEQVVVVSLERRFVNIKHLVPQVEGHAAARKKKEVM